MSTPARLPLTTEVQSLDRFGPSIARLRVTSGGFNTVTAALRRRVVAAQAEVLATLDLPAVLLADGEVVALNEAAAAEFPGLHVGSSWEPYVAPEDRADFDRALGDVRVRRRAAVIVRLQDGRTVAWRLARLPDGRVFAAFAP